MLGITSDNVDEAVEYMKMMCGDMLTCVQVGGTGGVGQLAMGYQGRLLLAVWLFGGWLEGATVICWYGRGAWR